MVIECVGFSVIMRQSDLTALSLRVCSPILSASSPTSCAATSCMFSATSSHSVERALAACRCARSEGEPSRWQRVTIAPDAAIDTLFALCPSDRAQSAPAASASMVPSLTFVAKVVPPFAITPSWPRHPYSAAAVWFAVWPRQMCMIARAAFACTAGVFCPPSGRFCCSSSVSVLMPP